jgi:hypothetical protein
MICWSPAEYPIETAVPALTGMAPTELEHDADAVAGNVPTAETVTEPLAAEPGPDGEPAADDDAGVADEAGVDPVAADEPVAEPADDALDPAVQDGAPLSRICTADATLVDTAVSVSSLVPLFAMTNCSEASVPFAQL